MTIKGEKVTEINAAYKDKFLFTTRKSALDLNVGHDDFWSDSIYKGNWQVCRIDEISDLIQELTLMKETIEDTMGILL